MKPRSLRNPNLNLLLPAWRAYVVCGFLLAGFGALILRGLYLQSIRTDFLQDQGEQRYSRVMTLEANRGMILDRNGEPLAISTPVEAVWASPADVVEAIEAPYKLKNQTVPADVARRPLWTEEQISRLAEVLGVRREELARKLGDRKKSFVYLKRQVTPDVTARVQSLNLPGIYKRQEFRRYYPFSDVMSHLIGYVGVDGVGQEGVELAFEKQLAGTPGSRHVIRDRRGRIVEDVASVEKPRDGQNIQLSIDRKLQYLAYRELTKAVQMHKAKAGSIVVLDARTGEVLALANSPSYNPNNRMTISMDNRRNRALTDTFEPGSTMKPFTASAALEAGTVRPDTMIDTLGGAMRIGPNTVHDAHPHGVLSVGQIIQVSSNIGSVKLAFSLKPEAFYNFLWNCGFGHATKVGFPGEVNGRLRPWKNWVPIDHATVSFGHGMTVTLMQMARGYTIFTHHGELLPVSILKQSAPPIGVRVIRPEVAETMRLMMEKVTQPGGTAIRAQVLGYRVAGKTGTANKLEGGRYVNRFISSFVGVAPVSDPRLIVAVMIDAPSAGSYYGGTVSAPVFSTVTGEALRMMGVPPDAPSESIVAPTKADDTAAAEIL